MWQVRKHVTVRSSTLCVLKTILAKVFVSLCTPGRRMGSRGVAPLSLNLGTRLMWVVSFTPCHFYLLSANVENMLNSE